MVSVTKPAKTDSYRGRLRSGLVGESFFLGGAQPPLLPLCKVTGDLDLERGAGRHWGME